MRKTIAALVVIFAVTYNFCNAQDVIKKDPNSILELKSNTLRSDSKQTAELKMPSATNKSAGLAMLLSLVLPGAGQYYEGRMDVGKYFLTAEAASWLGLVGINLYGNALREDARKFASQNSGLNQTGKPDDYYGNVGHFNSIYDYNNEKLQNGEYDKIYDVNSYYWNWNSVQNKNDFDLARRQSERVYNTKIVFSTALIVNRLISGLSALLLANKSPESMKIQSELTRDQFGSSGVTINFSKNF